MLSGTGIKRIIGGRRCDVLQEAGQRAVATDGSSCKGVLPLIGKWESHSTLPFSLCRQTGWHLHKWRKPIAEPVFQEGLPTILDTPQGWTRGSAPEKNGPTS